MMTSERGNLGETRERRVTHIMPIGDIAGQEYAVLDTRLDERSHLVQLVRGVPGGRWEIMASAFLGQQGTAYVLDRMMLDQIEAILKDRKFHQDFGDPVGDITIFVEAADRDECPQCGHYLRDCRCG